ncbi:MAG: phosphatidylserine decarboxylase [Pelovirga sp.]
MQQLHQYIDRRSGQVCNEQLISDPLIHWLYHPFREKAPKLFQLLISARSSALLSWWYYNRMLNGRLSAKARSLLATAGVFHECLEAPERLNTARKLFERQIRYWVYRPLPKEQNAILSPADAKALVGSLAHHPDIEIKGNFFNLSELLGTFSPRLGAFEGGDFAIFRLTPEKYHYNHTPVAGNVVDFYQVEGKFHSCNPGAVVAEVTPYSKNRRVVTIIDTDVPEGSGIGLVAMIEVVAMMIGEIEQFYCEDQYHAPQPIKTGMLLRKGVPKSRYRPGSSTDILLFQPGRVRFADDLVRNQQRSDVRSRFTSGFKIPLVETDIQVRSLLALPVETHHHS